MPQLDSRYYLSSLLWFAVSFGLLFAFVRFWLLPTLRKTFIDRDKEFRNKLREISSLRCATIAAERKFENKMNAARSQAQALIRAQLSSFESKKLDALCAFEANSSDLLKREAKKLQVTKDKLITNLEQASRELSNAIESRLIS